MSTYDHGPIQSYEIQWQSGHVEIIEAHQVIAPMQSAMPDIFGASANQGPPRVMFHKQDGDHWRLVLSALADDIRSIRNVTQAETLPTEETA